MRSPSSKFVTFADSHFLTDTPNHILNITDVPPRHDQAITSITSYPIDKRYTLQWLINPDPAEGSTFPNNLDATLQEAETIRSLLYYNYGAAAVKQ